MLALNFHRVKKLVWIKRCLQGQWSLSFSVRQASVLSYPQWIFFFISSQDVPLPLMTTVSCPTIHCCEEPDSIHTWLAPHRYWGLLLGVLKAVSAAGWTSLRPTASPDRASAPAHHLFEGLPWTSSSLSMSLLYWGDQNRMQYSRCGLISTENSK